jgi:ATP-dependent Lon protease
VLIPKENEKDLAEIPDNVKKGLNILPMNSVDELLKHALVSAPSPIEWTEPSDRPAAVVPREVEDDRPGLTH